jgi:hypothetical protein
MDPIRNTVHLTGGRLCCGAGAEIKLPFGAGAKITKCGSAPSADSFLFITGLKQFYRKKS